MPSSLIDNNAYYYLSSDLYGSSYLLGDSDGINSSAPGTLFLAQTSFSSNNWQIFHQDPIYLIRNYDYGARYQLGIAEESPTLPALLPVSGDLTQQWNVTLRDDGTFRIANMWLGNILLLGIGGKDNIPVPMMTAAQNGTYWHFSINLSNLTLNVAPDMLQSVSLQAVPPSTLTSTSTSTSTPTSISTAASTTGSSTAAGILLATTTITAGSVSSSSSSADSRYTTRRFISDGAIAGIGIAIFASALILFSLLFFMWWRRQQQRHGLPTNQAALAQQEHENWCTATHELGSRHPPFEIGGPIEKEAMRSPAVEIAG